VDAISTFHPYIIPAQKRLGVSAIMFQDKDIYSPTFNVVAKQEFIRQNPEKVKKVLRALIRAEEFVRQNKTEAQKMVADFSGVDLSLVRETWDVYNFAVTLNQSLLLALEDESKWAIRNRLTDSVKIPNYLDYVYLDGLASLKPKAVNILR
jgi:sulfonate transport system substrate-binding protein